jgi:hypothetical protein
MRKTTKENPTNDDEPKCLPKHDRSKTEDLRNCHVPEPLKYGRNNEDKSEEEDDNDENVRPSKIEKAAKYRH